LKQYFIADLSGLPIATEEWGILITVLLSDTHSAPLNSPWKDKTRNLTETFPVLQHNSSVDENNVIKELIETDEILTYKTENTVVGFVSDDVRHQVMSYFVLNCLNTVQDYENYIRVSSVDSLLEYVRQWEYKRNKDERCLYLPEELDESFIKKLGLLICCHKASSFHRHNVAEMCELLSVLAHKLRLLCFSDQLF
jgi:hypothetical protein